MGNISGNLFTADLTNLDTSSTEKPESPNKFSILDQEESSSEGIENPHNFQLPSASPDGKDEEEIPTEEAKTRGGRKSKKNYIEKTINSLKYAAETAKAQNQELQGYVAQQDGLINEQAKIIEQLRQMAVNNSDVTNKLYQHTFKNAQDAAMEKIRIAGRDADQDALAEGIKDIAYAISQEQTLNAYNKTQKDLAPPVLNQPYQPIKTPLPQAYSTPSIDPAQAAWIQENPWFVENEGLRNEALEIANELSARLSLSGHGHLNNTPEFRDTVKTILNDRYNTNPTSTVAPAATYSGDTSYSRRGAPSPNHPLATQPISDAELRMIKNMSPPAHNPNETYQQRLARYKSYRTQKPTQNPNSFGGAYRIDFNI